MPLFVCFVLHVGLRAGSYPFEAEGVGYCGSRNVSHKTSSAPASSLPPVPLIGIGFRFRGAPDPFHPSSALRRGGGPGGWAFRRRRLLRMVSMGRLQTTLCLRESGSQSDWVTLCHRTQKRSRRGNLAPNTMEKSK